MRAGFWALFVAILSATLIILPVYAEVESLNISPPVLVVGQPITFYGVVSRSSLSDRIGLYVYAGFNCPANPSIASTYTVVNNTTTATASNSTGIYNVTLAFPISASSGWVVERQYQNGLPAGTYSVGAQDMTTEAVLCKNFAVVSQQPTPEFSELTITVFLALLASLYVVRRKGSNHG